MKIVLGIIVAIIVVAAGYFLFFNKTQAPIQPETQTASPAGTVEMGSPEAENMGAAGEQVVTVAYGDTGFSPKSVTVPVGSTVKFVNNSGTTMWVASDQHPTHTEYDGTSLQEHCATKSSFDQCAGSATGTSYSFTFTKAGTFEYHNHARANDTGTVVVQ